MQSRLEALKLSALALRIADPETQSKNFHITNL